MPEHYTLKSGVVLQAISKAKVKKIADDYFAQTKKDIVVTSGTRSAQSQAEAMYIKFSQGGSFSIYKHASAAKEIYNIYKSASSGSSKSQIVADMELKITEQMTKQIYISKHLKAGAIDVRSRDMTQSEISTFKKVAKPYATTVILEKNPPHFHLSLQ